MTFSGHISAVSWVLVATGNPYFAVPLCLASHFVIDAIPHAEWQPWKRASFTVKILMVADSLATVLLVWLLYTRLPVNDWVVSAALLVTLLPDLTDRFARKYVPAFRYIHEMMHTWPISPVGPIDWNATLTGKVSNLVKVLTQSGIVGLGFFLVFVYA